MYAGTFITNEKKNITRNRSNDIFFCTNRKTNRWMHYAPKPDDIFTGENT